MPGQSPCLPQWLGAVISRSQHPHRRVAWCPLVADSDEDVPGEEASLWKVARDDSDPDPDGRQDS